MLDLQREAVGRTQGLEEGQLALVRALFRRIYDIVLDESDNGVASRKIRAEYDSLSAEEKALLDWSDDVLDLLIVQVLSPWYRYALTIDPSPILSQVQCPVLALYGEKDVQSTPRENLRAVEEALAAAGNPDYTVMELPDLNHLFQTAETGAASEYITIAETMSPLALKTISEWIRLRAGLPLLDTAVLEEQMGSVPRSFSLAQNYPNPFNAATVIRFALPQSGNVELSIYNLAGQKVGTLVEGMRQAGSYSINWDGKDDNGMELASGIYLYRLQTDNGQVEARKLLMLR